MELGGAGWSGEGEGRSNPPRPHLQLFREARHLGAFQAVQQFLRCDGRSAQGGAKLVQRFQNTRRLSLQAALQEGIGVDGSQVRGKCAAGEVGQVESQEDAGAAGESSVQNVLVVRVGQGVVAPGLSGHQGLGNSSVHHVPGALQPRAAQVGSVGWEVPDPFLVYFICPTGPDDPPNAQTHDQVTHQALVEDVRVAQDDRAMRDGCQ